MAAEDTTGALRVTAGPDVLPLLPDGVLLGAAGAESPGVTVETMDGAPVALHRIGRTASWMLQPRPESDVTLSTPGAAPLRIQVGGWSGRVDRVQGALITGWARNQRHPGRDCAVVAYDVTGVAAVATARAAEGGRFVLLLPPRLSGAGRAVTISLGIAGSDFRLDGGQVTLRPARAAQGVLQGRLLPRPVEQLAIRLKISTPNLKEAPMWGDYHFANSLAAAFEAIGHHAGVDTADAWYAHKVQEDVVIAIRGRHRVKTDPAKINIMWIISHPDRIPDEEFADYDHVAVASDIYAEELRRRGLPSVSVMHQATDARLFTPDAEVERRQAALFVGNSRKEYRTMVKWCLRRELPLELYGGGWEGVLPPGMVRAASVANAELPACYRSHLLLLNDHWDSMRENGFLSNRLFDGSGVATPILTDPVCGLAEVFGDAISEAGDEERFAAIVADCLADPAPYLARAARAHEIVMAGHTFDHRAASFAELIDHIAARKRRLG